MCSVHMDTYLWRLELNDMFFFLSAVAPVFFRFHLHFDCFNLNFTFQFVGGRSTFMEQSDRDKRGE